MLIDDLMYEGKGLFYYMDKVKPLPFNEELDLQEIDISFIALHGSRKLSPFIKRVIRDRDITDDVLKDVASAMIPLYYSKWTELYNLFKEDLPLDSYNMKTTETITDDGEVVGNTVNDFNKVDTNQVTGYNTDEFVDNEKTEKVDTETISNTSTSNHNKQRTLEVKGTTGNVISDRIKSIEYLKTNRICDIMFTDISRLIGLLIY